MNAYKKLNQARNEFHSAALKKTGKNTFSGYNYFELGDFIPAALRIFDSLGLCAVISFTKDYADMRIVDTETGESIVISSPMSEASLKGCHAVQNLGAVQTYLRRYLWMTALEIVEHDALDATTGKVEPDTVVEIQRQHDTHLKALSTAPDTLNLKRAWLQAHKWAEQHPDYMDEFTHAKDNRKAELEQAA